MFTRRSGLKILDTLQREGFHALQRVLKYDVGLQSVRSQTLCARVVFLISTERSGPKKLDTLQREGYIALQMVLGGSRLATCRPQYGKPRKHIGNPLESRIVYTDWSLVAACCYSS